MHSSSPRRSAPRAPSAGPSPCHASRRSNSTEASAGPGAAEGEVTDRLAVARHLAGAQFLVERCDLANPADHRRRLETVALRHLQLSPGAIEIDSDHAMRVIAEHRRLQRQAGPGGASVEAVAVRWAGLAG